MNQLFSNTTSDRKRDAFDYYENIWATVKLLSNAVKLCHYLHILSKICVILSKYFIKMNINFIFAM